MFQIPGGTGPAGTGQMNRRTRLARHPLGARNAFPGAEVGNGRGSDGQAFTAFAATGGEHGATGSSAHADEKSVGALAAPVVGLKGTFHVENPNSLKRKR
jgi:hypothetical protein